jgi:hypothetical protein
LDAIGQKYTDSQHFGRGRPFRSISYLYQSIPGTTSGKRDISQRWRFIEAELLRAGIMPRIGCSWMLDVVLE